MGRIVDWVVDDDCGGGGNYFREFESSMTGSKRRQEKRNRKISRIIGITALGLAVIGLVHVLDATGCI